MKLNRNSWHFRFLERWDANIVLHGTINLCPYVRELALYLFGALALAPLAGAIIIFLGLSPAIYGLFWFLTGGAVFGGIVFAFALPATIVYIVVLAVYSTNFLWGITSSTRSVASQSLPYQAVKSWHDKVCPVMELVEE